MCLGRQAMTGGHGWALCVAERKGVRDRGWESKGWAGAGGWGRGEVRGESR